MCTKPAYTTHVALILQGDYSAAGQQLHQCLQALGRPLPVSTSDSVSGILWQLFRQFLQRLYVGRWLAAHAGGLRSSKAHSMEVKESARDAALVYHLLNQLHLSGKTCFSGNVSSDIAFTPLACKQVFLLSVCLTASTLRREPCTSML